MKSSGKTVIGIDVGDENKHFYGVALRGGNLTQERFRKAGQMAEWCLEQGAEVIAIDAPCAWAVSGGSRFAERSLGIGGVTIQCFKTPTRSAAEGRAFYGWIFNGEKLYQQFLPHYCLYDGTRREEKTVFETFPHAIMCALAGRVVPARPKTPTRRRMLHELGYDVTMLTNLDLDDAALCALTAERFLLDQTRQFGDCDEGFIVVPEWEEIRAISI